jgi:hypothetical protein
MEKGKGEEVISEKKTILAEEEGKDVEMSKMAALAKGLKRKVSAIDIPEELPDHGGADEVFTEQERAAGRL